MAIRIDPPQRGPGTLPSRHWRRMIGLTVSAVALIWVGILLWRAWPEFVYGLSQVDRLNLVAGFMLVTLATGLVFEAFRPLVRLSRITGLSVRQLGHLYFTAQLLRHLPGRIWGIGYQIAGGRSGGSAAAWLAANVLHMLLASYFALLISLIVLAAPNTAWLSVLIAGAGISLLAGALCLSRSGWISRRVRAIDGRIGVGLGMILDSVRRADLADIMHAGLALISSWIAMYAAWLCFAVAYPGLAASDGLRLLALYMIAWFVGYASLLTPSGLGVRELVFVALANDYGSDVVAYLAIAGRTSLLVGDLLLGVLFAPFAPLHARDPRL